VRASVPGARAGRVLAILIVFCPCLFLSTLESVEKNQVSEFLPKDRDIPGWTAKEAISEFDREGLYGHINGGAEIFLQYEFQHLTVGSYKRTAGDEESEIVLEVYRLASPLEAFGMFSVKRAAEETVSPEISALNWVSDFQVNLVKDTYFINILGFECEPKELQAFAIFIAAKIPGASYFPGILERFPRDHRIANSGKYLQGTGVFHALSTLQFQIDPA